MVRRSTWHQGRTEVDALAFEKHHLVQQGPWLLLEGSGISVSLCGVFKSEQPFYFDGCFSSANSRKEIIHIWAWKYFQELQTLQPSGNFRANFSNVDNRGVWKIKMVQVIVREAYFHLSYLQPWYNKTPFAFILENDFGQLAPSDAPTNNAAVCMSAVWDGGTLYSAKVKLLTDLKHFEYEIKHYNMTSRFTFTSFLKAYWRSAVADAALLYCEVIITQSAVHRYGVQ